MTETLIEKVKQKTNTPTMRGTVRVVCYGSLKKGYFNHFMLGEGAKYLGNHKLQGEMYLVADAYPILFKGCNSYDAEVYEILHEDYANVHKMEISAGYELCTINTPYGFAVAFYGDKNKWDDLYYLLRPIDSY